MSLLSRLILLLAAAVALIAPSLAQAAVGEASRSEALNALDRAEAALSGATPSSRTLAAGAPESHEATTALLDLAVALPALDGVERRRAERILARPTEGGRGDYFGPEAADSPICSARFCVHWSDRESDAPLSQQYIEQVAAAAERSYSIENGELGWREAKSDGTLGSRAGKGGAGQADVYIAGLGGGLYGFASTDPGQGNDTKRFSYLVVDNDYEGFAGTPVELMRATVAHEYNHVLQFSYDVYQQLWIGESTATWMEEQVFPGVDDYLNYLRAFAQKPGVPLTRSNFKVYGSAVWNHWLSSRLGSETVRESWALSTQVRPQHFAVAAYERAIEDSGGRSFSRQFAKFATETSEWRGSNAFPDAGSYPDVRRDGKLLPEGNAKRFRLDNTSYRLLKARARGGGAITLSVKAERGTRSAIALVGREGAPTSRRVTVSSRYLAGGGRGRVRLARPGGFERITAVVVNADGRGGFGSSREPRYRADDSAYRVKLR